MKSYQFWTEQAKRWSESVDYGSPMSAWTSQMFEILNQCNGDKLKATIILREQKKKIIKNTG